MKSRSFPKNREASGFLLLHSNYFDVAFEIGIEPKMFHVKQSNIT